MQVENPGKWDIPNLEKSLKIRVACYTPINAFYERITIIWHKTEYSKVPAMKRKIYTAMNAVDFIIPDIIAVFKIF